MREYVYIPLGGNRVVVWRAYLNLIIVFALSGIWHGANWTFLVWGLYHGLFIVLDKAGLVRLTERLPKIFNAIITFVLVMIGWVFFRSDTIGQAVQFIGAMLGLAQTPPPGAIFLADVIGFRTWISFVLAFIFSFLPLFASWEKIEAWVKEHMNHPVLLVCAYIFAFIISGLAILYLVNAEFNPFIYFRF